MDAEHERKKTLASMKLVQLAQSWSIFERTSNKSKSTQFLFSKEEGENRSQSWLMRALIPKPDKH